MANKKLYDRERVIPSIRKEEIFLLLCGQRALQFPLAPVPTNHSASPVQKVHFNNVRNEWIVET